MTAVVVASWQIFIRAVNLFHHHASGGRSHHLLENGPNVGPWPVSGIVISLSIMILVLVSAEAFLHLLGTRLTPTPPPVITDDSSTSRLAEMAVKTIDYGHPGPAIPTNGAEAAKQSFLLLPSAMVSEPATAGVVPLSGKPPPKL